MNGEHNKSVGVPTPTDELLGRELAKQEAAKAANSMPLPGALAEAFPVEEVANVTLGKFIVRPMTASDMAVLQKVDSPFCSLASAASSNEIAFTVDDMVTAVFIFTRPPRVSYDLVKSGKQALVDEAMDKIGSVLSPDDLGKLFSVIGSKVPQTFEVAISYGASEKAEDADVTTVNFPDSNP